LPTGKGPIYHGAWTSKIHCTSTYSLGHAILWSFSLVHSDQQYTFQPRNNILNLLLQLSSSLITCTMPSNPAICPACKNLPSCEPSTSRTASVHVASLTVTLFVDNKSVYESIAVLHAYVLMDARGRNRQPIRRPQHVVRLPALREWC
jgi:hypothetical protein